MRDEREGSQGTPLVFLRTSVGVSHAGILLCNEMPFALLKSRGLRSLDQLRVFQGIVVWPFREIEWMDLVAANLVIFVIPILTDFT